MIIFDLDGTLADCEHRRHFVDPKYNIYDYVNKKWKPDWKAFYEACDKDIPIKPVIDLLWRLDPYETKISIWSGRCESVREKTVQWVIEYVFLGNFITLQQIELKMRPIGDSIPDDKLKEKWLDEALAQGKTIDFVIDDRKKVTDMWNRRGIFVFDVSQGKGDF